MNEVSLTLFLSITKKKYDDPFRFNSHHSDTNFKSLIMEEFPIGESCKIISIFLLGILTLIYNLGE